LAYNDNLVNLQLTDLRGLYQATLNDRLDAFDKTAKELSSAMASDAASVNNTVNDLNGNSTPPSSVPIPASPTTPASIPTDSSPPLERSSPVMPVSGTPSGKCKPGENFTNSIGIEMIWMAPLKCWVSKYDVTQEQYEKVTGNNPSTYQGARMPVETVSWNEGVAYAKKLTLMERTANLLPEGYQYSLPTDAQYDVYVGNASLDDAVTSQSESRSSPATVGSKGANNFGLYDTRGNVWQWCLDWYRADMNSSEIRDNNSALNDDGGGQKFKVLRGASWGHDDSDYLTTSFRSYNDPGIRRDRNGIRVVLVPHGG
jgi:formylglycine-generating enzyme required for sulfatase activity